jgi:ribosomal protein S19E (S16A)
MTLSCNVCGGSQRRSHSNVLLGRYEAIYGLCDDCGFLSVHEPCWLDEAYADTIAALDTGILERNLMVANQLVLLLRLFFAGGPYLDVGAGHGLLVRRMRDLGYDFYWSDAYAKNLYARGFEDDGRTYQVVTAIEVMEHLVDPFNAVRNWIDNTGSEAFVFTQQTFEGEPPPRDWWYYAAASGQHISFYQPQTLDFMAKRLGMAYERAGGLHLFTRSRLSGRIRRLLARGRVAPLASRWLSRESLTQRDFETISDGRPGLGA